MLKKMGSGEETAQPPATLGAIQLPAALLVTPGPRAASSDGVNAEETSAVQARRLLQSGEVIVAHAALTARRLGLDAPGRSRRVFDALELFAFVRPAKFCAPSAVGLARALGLAEPKTLKDQAQSLPHLCRTLLSDLAAAPWPSREEVLALAQTLDRAGWAWGPRVLDALQSRPLGRPWRGGGLDVWSRLTEWEDAAPAGEAGSKPVSGEAAQARLTELLARAGLDEARPTQAEFAAQTAYTFEPRDREGAPRLMLAEAGTGVGKTLGYLAPASLWAELNGGAVWVSTYTRALQRQIERESRAIHPDPEIRARKAVVRKGRENYLCLLNLQETVQAASLGGGDLIGASLTARWVRATRDGDMTGGDYPAWLPGLFSVNPAAQANAANLIDRRGECVHAACPHYRTCFVEKATRASRRADLVIANHALVLTQAAFDGARSARRQKPDGETASLKRIVFDEGHHLFEAADAAFSACLSGQEAAELRRWIRGPEGRRRGRGLDQRLGDLIGEDQAASRALGDVLQAALALPAEGWSGRIAPIVERDGRSGRAAPAGPVEGFLAAVHDHGQGAGGSKGRGGRRMRRTAGGRGCAVERAISGPGAQRGRGAVDRAGSGAGGSSGSRR